MTRKGREAMADEHAPHHALLLQFLGALLQRTVDCPTAAAHQQALQGFLDDLTPWVSPADLPTLLGQPFTLFDHLAFTPNGIKGAGDVGVALSPGGEGPVRACARQALVEAIQCLRIDPMPATRSLEDLGAARVAQSLDTRGMPDPERVLRPSGAERVSNVFLWPLADAALCGLVVLWPACRTHAV